MSSTEVMAALRRIMVSHVPKTVTFTYTTDEGQSKREVEPYEVKGGKLYGHCKVADATRQFFLERMSNVQEGETFRPRFPIKVPL